MSSESFSPTPVTIAKIPLYEPSSDNVNTQPNAWYVEAGGSKAFVVSNEAPILPIDPQTGQPFSEDIPPVYVLNVDANESGGLAHELLKRGFENVQTIVPQAPKRQTPVAWMREQAQFWGSRIVNRDKHVIDPITIEGLDTQELYQQALSIEMTQRNFAEIEAEINDIPQRNRNRDIVWLDGSTSPDQIEALIRGNVRFLVIPDEILNNPEQREALGLDHKNLYAIPASEMVSNEPVWNPLQRAMLRKHLWWGPVAEAGESLQEQEHKRLDSGELYDFINSLDPRIGAYLWTTGVSGPQSMEMNDTWANILAHEFTAMGLAYSYLKLQGVSEAKILKGVWEEALHDEDKPDNKKFVGFIGRKLGHPKYKSAATTWTETGSYDKGTRVTSIYTKNMSPGLQSLRLPDSGVGQRKVNGKQYDAPTQPVERIRQLAIRDDARNAEYPDMLTHSEQAGAIVHGPGIKHYDQLLIATEECERDITERINRYRPLERRIRPDQLLSEAVNTVTRDVLRWNRVNKRSANYRTAA